MSKKEKCMESGTGVFKFRRSLETPAPAPAASSRLTAARFLLTRSCPSFPCPPSFQTTTWMSTSLGAQVTSSLVFLSSLHGSQKWSNLAGWFSNLFRSFYCLNVFLFAGQAPAQEAKGPTTDNRVGAIHPIDARSDHRGSFFPSRVQEVLSCGFRFFGWDWLYTHWGSDICWSSNYFQKLCHLFSDIFSGKLLVGEHFFVPLVCQAWHIHWPSTKSKCFDSLWRIPEVWRTTSPTPSAVGFPWRWNSGVPQANFYLQVIWTERLRCFHDNRLAPRCPNITFFLLFFCRGV